MSTKNNINGWLIIDKPYHVGSTTVVTRLKHCLSPSKIGHAGTLDPLATGVLPIALGTATRLIPYVMDGQKTYEFQITWGAETSTDDTAGEVVTTSDIRPIQAEIEAVLPEFVGTINQLPPAYSALKINGQRAYDLARSGQEVVLCPRPIRIDSLELISCTRDTADFRVSCGKGTYVRSLGRDIGRRIGCLGHITVLRRIKCGPFSLSDAMPMHMFDTPKQPEDVSFLPLDTALEHMPKIILPYTEAHRLTQGQRLSAKQWQHCLSRPIQAEEVVCLYSDGKLLGLVKIDKHTIHPYRIFSTF